MAEKVASAEKVICENRRARFDYAIDDTVEAGLMLTGSEVKALRNHEASLSDSYALPDKGELFLLNAHIGAYTPAATFAHLPTRPRKLLMHKAEIEKWAAKVRERGYTIVPLVLYFKDGRAKVRLGLGKGKNTIDRREGIRERETKRELDRLKRRR
ncbi:MAG: SsrA-binding protein [Myxococcaceae bacterium]